MSTEGQYKPSPENSPGSYKMGEKPKLKTDVEGMTTRLREKIKREKDPDKKHRLKIIIKELYWLEDQL